MRVRACVRACVCVCVCVCVRARARACVRSRARAFVLCALNFDNIYLKRMCKRLWLVQIRRSKYYSYMKGQIFLSLIGNVCCQYAKVVFQSSFGI